MHDWYSGCGDVTMFILIDEALASRDGPKDKENTLDPNESAICARRIESNCRKGVIGANRWG